jgi:hypothetical protein
MLILIEAVTVTSLSRCLQPNMLPQRDDQQPEVFDAFGGDELVGSPNGYQAGGSWNRPATMPGTVMSSSNFSHRNA